MCILLVFFFKYWVRTKQLCAVLCYLLSVQLLQFFLLSSHNLILLTQPAEFSLRRNKKKKYDHNAHISWTVSYHKNLRRHPLPLAYKCMLDSWSLLDLTVEKDETSDRGIKSAHATLQSGDLMQCHDEALLLWATGLIIKMKLILGLIRHTFLNEAVGQQVSLNTVSLLMIIVFSVVSSRDICLHQQQHWFYWKGRHVKQCC